MTILRIIISYFNMLSGFTKQRDKKTEYQLLSTADKKKILTGERETETRAEFPTDLINENGLIEQVEGDPKETGGLSENRITIMSWVYSITLFITLVLGILAKHFLDGTLEENQSILLIAIIIAIVIFPGVGKSALKMFDEKFDDIKLRVPTIFTVASFTFTSGIGYETLFVSVIKTVGVG